jgi:redox-sensitive bicupin YhaK (pirin superfamily)
MGYRSLRVINDDTFDASSGFGEHGHDNMEILTWVLEGRLHHRDSTGGEGDLRPGELQAMTAGRGLTHSEVNDSTEPVHLLQIWIEPDAQNLEPTYTQKAFPKEGRSGRWQVLASPDARDGSLRIHQDATLRVAELGRGQEIGLELGSGRHAYVHVAYGDVQVGDVALKAGDAITFSGAERLGFTAKEESQILFFDLA